MKKYVPSIVTDDACVSFVIKKKKTDTTTINITFSYKIYNCFEFLDLCLYIRGFEKLEIILLNPQKKSEKYFSEKRFLNSYILKLTIPACFAYCSTDSRWTGNLRFNLLQILYPFNCSAEGFSSFFSKSFLFQHHQIALLPCGNLGLLKNRPLKQSVSSLVHNPVMRKGRDCIRDIVNPSYF